MEVHHHAQAHGKKTFREHFLEFLMLFLAVTLGFFAENLREHLAEQKKEKEYIASFVNDLQKDTADISITTKRLFNNIWGEDSLVYLLQHYRNNDSVNRKCYRHYLRSAVNVAFATFNQNTLNQLLNTGSIRLIGKQNIMDSLMDYNGQVKAAVLQADYYNDEFKKAFDYSTNIFDLSYIHVQVKKDYSFQPMMRYDTARFQLVNTDPVTLQKYAAYLIMQQTLSSNYLLQLKGVKENAQRLIALLKNQYHIKKEE